MKNKLLVSIVGVAVMGIFMYYAFSPNITKIYKNQQTETEEPTSGTTAVPTW